MRQICVCELEQMEFSKPGDTPEEARNHNRQAMNRIKSTDTMPDGEKVTVIGHWNEAGGVCCPHFGNTCGFHYL